MQKIGALIVAVVLALLFAADPVVCSDGCTDNPRSQSKTATCCTFCQRGIALDGAALTVAPATIVQPAPSAAPAVVLPALVHSIYHPPRST